MFQVRYRLAPHVSLGPAWPEECVVYDAASARTHVITADAMAVLRAIADAPDDADGVAGRLGIAAGEADVAAAVEGVLLEFGRLGILAAQSD